ncbi:unnamed protein product [Oppiella nova]|uniref:Ig-like domain-containing protein n=1 Tax=Oppiella nova TaxID=334625 RepID=A0A7R9L997_9ACAR|nr:unnamed protein product [Oppiella nova]CAG2160554.1 unnamed protein product [Oppiella nova]
MFGQILLILCVGATKWLAFGLEATESTADAPVLVKGVAGQSAALPCHIDQAQCGEVYFLTWTKLERDDRWSRIYIFADNVEKPLRDLSGRARFSLHKSEAQLSINQLKSGDEALYKCDVTYVGGKCPSLTFVRLEIIAKPSKAYIEYKNSQLENGIEIRGVEGDLLRLACIVIGGKPMPTVSWRAIDENGLAETIESRYECHVQHEAIKNNSMDSHVMIDVTVGAKSIEIVGPRDHIKEGDVALIQCIAYGSKPETQIVWKNGSHIIDTVVKSEVEPNSDGSTLNTRSYLELRVSRFDHLNAIECQASNTAMKEAIKQSIELKIQYPPIVVMEPKNGLIVNESTDMVNIYCTFSSNPPEIIENSTKWYKDNQILALNDSQHYMSSLSGYPILTIVNPMRNDSGAYFCSVSNDIGIGKPEEPSRLNVLFPPTVNLQIYPNPEQGFTIKEGDDVRMICDIIDGNPLNASKVKWMKNGHQLVSELSGESSSHKEITWLSVTRTLSGNYTCLAISDAGVSEVSNSVQIDVSYPPSKALIRQLTGIHAIKGHNLTLECIVSDEGKPSTNTEYQWESADGVPFQTKQSILYLTDLKLTNSGNISCAAVNEVGIGPKGIFQVTPLAPPKIIDFLPPTLGINENKLKTNSAHQHQHEEPISISCRIECFPICQIYWYKNNQLIDNSSQLYTIKNSIHPEELSLNRFVSVVSTLIFNLSALSPLDRSRDSKVFYSCVSSDNSVGPSVKSETQFIVEYPPENLRVRPKRVDVIEYDIPPEILCESDALPPASYRWHSSSTRDKSIGVIADTPLLSLNTTIQRDRAGTYTCIASNRHGEDHIDLLINVLFAPTCTLYESRTDDQEIELICAVTAANPNNELTFNWFFNNTLLNETISDRMVRHEGMKSKIVIPITGETLFGSWTCAVTNSIGQTDPNCTLYVSPPIVVADWEALGDDADMSYEETPSQTSPSFADLFFQNRLEFRKHEKNVSNESVGARKLPGNGNDPNLAIDNREMYENMPFQRKCMQLSGTYNPGTYMPEYNQNMAQLTQELRRTQSARYHNCQPFGVEMDDLLYADMYDDVKSGKVKDPRIKPPLPPKGAPVQAKPPKRPPKTQKAL